MSNRAYDRLTIRGARTLNAVPGIDDPAIQERLRAGDREGAYPAMVEATRDSLFRYLMHMLRDRDAAREVFQDTYVRAFRSLDRFRGESSATTWVIAIGRNLALNRLRDAKTRDRYHAPEADGAAVAAAPPADPASRTLLAALDDLPDPQREAVLLFYVEERPVAEVARIVRRPVNTVKSDLSRARERLRAALETKEPS